MASIPVTFQGVLTYTDVGVGGGPMPGGPQPSHPIAPGGQPPGIWGGAPPYVDIGGPGPQPGPSHPIAPGGRPPGIWGGAPPYVDIGGPGPQPSPEHPIVIPPGQEAPKSFTVIVKDDASGEWKAVTFVPGDPDKVPPAKPPTTPGPKTP